jgi:hypothetical protein
VYPSKQKQQALPPLSPTPASQGGSNHNSDTAASNNSSGGKANGNSPFSLPIMLGLFGHFPLASYKQRKNRFIAEISRRLKNGIGFLFAARSPNIWAVNEGSLALVHQVTQEVSPTFVLPSYRKTPFINSEEKSSLLIFLAISLPKTTSFWINFYRFYPAQGSYSYTGFLFTADGKNIQKGSEVEKEEER